MKRFAVILLLLACAVLPSCRKTGLGDSDDGKILFRIAGDWRDGTKGRDELDSLNLNHFITFATIHQNPTFGNGDRIGNYFFGRPARSQGNGEFCLDTVAYWPASGYGYLSFFAYTPAAQVRIDANQQDSLVIRFEQYSTVTSQVDFCVAEPVLGRSAPPFNPVPLNFRHTLTNIEFAAKYVDPSNILDSLGYSVRLDSIRVSNVVGTRDIVIKPDSTFFHWKDNISSHSKVDYLITRVGSQLSQNLLDTVLTVSTLADGRMYLLPQKLDENASVKVTFSLGTQVYQRGVTRFYTVATFTEQLSLPRYADDTPEWRPAQKVRYNLTIDLSNIKKFEVKASVYEGHWHDDWQDAEPITPRIIE